jgi:3'-phosphoadenosine 5'-phosphosulfate sulfotransferase (PAPS reductase)/FAD synthetase
MEPRVLSWFSCGDASAVAARIAVEQYQGVEVLYCDTLAYEHPDNIRFLHDVERWVGQPIQVLKNPDYRDIYDVFEKTRYLVGPKGALCTTELKKVVRKRYQRVDDLHIFGYTVDEGVRIVRFHQENPEINARFPLFEQGLTKDDCHRIVREAGIQLPMMYRLGYKNNNCIGCVKGGMGYWNKVRRDFPDIFQKMARQERDLNVAILSKQVRGVRVRVFLDELDPLAGRLEDEPDIECGVLCTTGA